MTVYLCMEKKKKSIPILIALWRLKGGVKLTDDYAAIQFT